jgi:hypothetical protein
MYSFPGIHAELRDTGWVKNPEGTGRPCQGIYAYEDTASVLRATKVATFFPGHSGEVTTEETLALIGKADEQFARLQSFGVEVIGFSRLVTTDDAGTPFILTRADKAEPAASPSAESGDVLLAGLTSYMHDAFDQRTPLLRDIFKPEQYMHGHTKSSPTNTFRLIDVDPVVVDPKNLGGEWSALNFVSVDHAVDFFSDKARAGIENMIFPETQRSVDGVASLLVEMPKACDAMLGYLQRRLSLTTGFNRRTFEERITAINRARKAKSNI